MDHGERTPAAVSRRVLTLPNAITFLRILAIPVFVALIVDPDTTTAGLILFGVVVSTDWIDGWLARRLGQVSELGKVLDPLADRLAIAAGLIALMVRGVFPVWAGGLILLRDVVVVAAVLVLARRSVRIEVRWIGKLATFALMTSIAFIAWGTLELPLAQTALVAGWAAYAVGIVEYYVAAGIYAMDAAREIRASHAADPGEDYRVPPTPG
ncbi:MAG TPA: CDP-alcohol phosphatidyltransferase family protein [Actinomycetota bacterium]|jgi:cardiolipin synthase